MPVIASQLVSKIAVEGDTEAKAKLSAYSKKVDEANATAGKIGDTLKMGLMVGGASLLTLGATATKMAGDYNAGLTSLVTGAGELPKNLQMVHDQMLQISTDTGTMTDQLIAGEYMINSSGQKGSQALLTLKDAAEGAKVGASDLGTVADATTTIMTDFSRQHITAAQAVNTLIATVSDGKTHMADLAGSFATILPIASAFGLHLQDITGAMATMTGEGVPAADAATYLRQTIASLESPGSNAVKVLKDIGLTSAQISDSMKVSIPGTLQLIEDHLALKFPVGSAAYMNALKDIAGGTKTFQGMLDLTGTHLDTFKANVVDITSKVKQGGDSIVGWTQVQGDFNQKLDETHAAFDAMLIKLGEELMPIVSKFLTDDVMPAISHFEEWEGQTHGLENAFSDVVGVLGTVISDTEAVVSWFAKGGIQTDILKVALLGVGGAIATIKLMDLGKDMLNVATVYGPKLVNLLNGSTNSITTAAKAASTGLTDIGTTAKTTMVTDVTTGATEAETAIAGIGTTAGTTAGEVATASTGMEGSLSGVLGALKGIGIGMAGFGAMGMVPDTKNLDPNSDIFKAYEKGMTLDQYEKSKQSASAVQQQLKDTDKEIQQAYQDMSDLYDEYHSFAGYNPNSTLPFFNSYITKVDETKSHLDDLSNAVYLDGSLKPTIITPLSRDAETASNKMRVLKDSIDDMTYNAIDDFNKLIGYTGSTFKVNVNAYQSYAGRDDPKTLPGHATGILNSPFGHWAMVGERGPEPMYIPQGASVFPSGSNVGAAQQQQAPVYLQIDGQTFARLVLPYVAGTVRSGLGMVGV